MDEIERATAGKWRVIGIDKDGQRHDLEQSVFYTDAREALRRARAWQTRRDGPESLSLVMVLRDGTSEDLPIETVALERQPDGKTKVERWDIDGLERFLAGKPHELLEKLLGEKLR